jgi:hypothetical protein
MKQGFFKTTVLQILIEAEHGLVDTWGGFGVVETSFHKSSYELVNKKT